MDLVMRFWAVTLLLAGGPLFIGMAVMFGAMAFSGKPSNPDEFIPRFLLLYIAFAVSGLLTASGCVVWAVAKMAYPTKESRKERVN